MIIKTLYDAGEFKSINPHFEGECVSVFGLNGPEDITILKNGLAFISADDRWKTLAENPSQGHIYLYDLNDENPELINLTLNLEIDFHPHGISVFEDSLNNIHLFVVNHVDNIHSIEVFNYKNEKLIHNSTIKSPLLISPNDLVAINENQFYVTNDHGTASRFLKTIQDYLQISNSNVIFYDGEQFEISALGLRYANGINISKDKKLVYVAETIGQKLSIFSRNDETNELRLSNMLEMNSGIDNIEIDMEGNLWIGSHPQMLAFSRHAKDENNRSPSQVLKVTQDSNNNYVFDEIYLNNGESLSGSSVSAIYKNHLLIGAVFTDHFLHCKN
jgi:arylesterase / paraoxonase